MVGDGLCACGCGAKTVISDKTDRKQGDVKGQPKKYILGHHHIKQDRYIIEDRGYKTPCWVWILSKNKFGYGKCEIKGKHRLAHIVSYEKNYGPVPEGLQLDHLCRVSSCIRPDHLEAVTGAVNTRRGNCAKITMEDAKQIRVLYKFGEKQKDLGEQYGLHPMTISRIVRNVTWKVN